MNFEFWFLCEHLFIANIEIDSGKEFGVFWNLCKVSLNGRLNWRLWGRSIGKNVDFCRDVGENCSFWWEIEFFGEKFDKIKLFWDNLSFFRVVERFWGYLSVFWRNSSVFLRKVKYFFNGVKHSWEKLRIFWEKISIFGKDGAS